ncbi:hypothetical protein J2S49_000231 [Arcanobacterium wilhelmae]|uniref:DUF3710 domain-containing protein n=1 Tax=Arcanobacterium wilhelmae TaxID=1803177 RepID=A0ABT9N8X8_9ACTO|nr:DUF3710 domain-containing protein [Arcanobacterium wilhelmae]MDP9800155.1 hypothetical protein [Arcanobacterium wilhelmae]WFN89595.1 DUF3710 domain-containing protein [Arcanobacterium wilhelmae]
MSWFSRKKKETSAPAPAAEEKPKKAAHGPYDAAEISEPGELLDAGSLLIPAVPGAQLQLTLNEDRTTVVGVVYVLDGSALQLQAFAAPKSRGIWDEVRLDMRTSIAAQGGSSVEVDGTYGKELRAQMPVEGGTAPHRFLGIDGHRWLLRATLYGRAGADDAAAAHILQILDRVAVRRGSEPHPPRELLALQIPEQIQASLQPVES